jgi:hypothetical protein
VPESKDLRSLEDDTGDEAWVRAADGEHAVRLRALNAYIDKGGVVTEARLIENAEGVWTIRLRLAGRPGEWIVNRFDSDAPRAYKDVGLAINSIFKDLKYRGAIIVSTERDYASHTV